MRRFLIALLVVSFSAGMATNVEAGKVKVPDSVKNKARDYAKKAGEVVAQSEAWDATKSGAKKLKDKIQKECHNTQGGNHANSTPAVRTCN